MNKVIEVEISKGKQILIDERDYKLIFVELGLDKWSVKSQGDSICAFKTLGKNQLKRLNDHLASIGAKKVKPTKKGTKNIFLDKLIMGLTDSEVKHHNGNLLDNRRVNLRVDN